LVTGDLRVDLKPAVSHKFDILWDMSYPHFKESIIMAEGVNVRFSGAVKSFVEHRSGENGHRIFLENLVPKWLRPILKESPGT
jgi:hypothetical protein